MSLFNCTVIIGEFANFVAYMYAPAVLVTPLGALSIIVRWVHSFSFQLEKKYYSYQVISCKLNWSLFIGSAILAHFLLGEKLQKLGILGCVLCVVGSTVIVLHAPGEHSISSVDEIWELAVQPGGLILLSCFKKDVTLFLNIFLVSWPRFSFIHSFSCGSDIGACFVL